MRILLVSTWRQRCGIATYSADLACVLQSHELSPGHSVIVHGEDTPPDKRCPQQVGQVVTDSPQPTCARTRHHPGECSRARDDIVDTDPVVRRSWFRADFQSTRLVPALLEDKPDVVHFQHEFGLFQNDNQFLRVLEQLRDAHVRTAVTLHTIHGHYEPFYRMLASRGARLIVHTAPAATMLANFGCASRIIPHGVTLRRTVTTEMQLDARKRLGIGRCFLGLVPGFITRGKGHSEILGAFVRHMAAAHSVPTTVPQRLIIVGEFRDMEESELKGDIGLRGVTDIVMLHGGYKESLDDYFTAADYVVLGSNPDTPYSASGQLHTALGYGLPVIAKNSPIYAGSEGVLYYSNPHEAAAMMGGIWGSADVRDTLRRLQLKTAAARSWLTVARRHVDVYVA